MKNKNILREKLSSGKPTLSTHIHSVWPAVIEAIGSTGFYDYVEFVAEYGPSDLHDLDNMCRTAELYNLGTMIKIDQSLMPFLAQRGIGAGFNSVLFTDVRSISEVKDCIRSARPDHPDHGGLYGVATRRNTYNLESYGGSEAYVKSVASTVLAFMIEKKGAVDDLENILNLPDVEMVQWGGSDFSMNLGVTKEDPQVIQAKKKTFETAISLGVPPRAEISSSDEVKEYLDIGVKHFSIGTDISILKSFWQKEGEEIVKSLEGK